MEFGVKRCILKIGFGGWGSGSVGKELTGSECRAQQRLCVSITPSMETWRQVDPWDTLVSQCH